MEHVTLDAVALSKLLGHNQSVEVRDESGRTVGHFFPMEDRSLYEGLEVPITEEELQRAEQEPGGFTMEEVRAHLKSLGTA